MGIGIAHTILILKISVSTIILRITDAITFLLNVYFSSFLRIRKSDDLVAIFFLNLAKNKKNIQLLNLIELTSPGCDSKGLFVHVYYNHIDI